MHGLRGRGQCRRTQLEVDDRRGGVRGDRDSADAVEHCADSTHVRVLRIDGVFCGMLMPSEVETVRSAKMAAEETNEVLLICW